MATETMTALADAFKRVYEDGFPKAFNEEAVAMQLSEPMIRSFSGGDERFAIQLGRSAGVGSRSETGAFATPRGIVVSQGSVPLSRIFKVFELSHDVIARSKSDEAAFREVLGLEIEAAFDRVLKVMNFYFYGDGTGVLATVATGGGGTLAAANGSTLQITVDTTRYLEANDAVALWTTATGATVLSNGGQTDSADKDAVIVSSVDSATKATLKRTAAANGAATVVAANALRLFDDATTDGSTRTDNVLQGLQLFADTTAIATSFEGINRSTNPRWQGQVIVATNEDLTRHHLQRINDKIRRNSGEKMDCIIWDPSLRREYVANLVSPDVRFAPVRENDAGYSEESLMLTLGGKRIRLIEDVDVPFGMLFGLAKSQLWRMELSPIELDASTGSFLRQGQPYGASGVGDVFYGFIRWKGNMATPKAPAFGKVTGLLRTSDD